MSESVEIQDHEDFDPQSVLDAVVEENSGKRKRGRPPKNRSKMEAQTDEDDSLEEEPSIQEDDVSQRRRGKMSQGKRPTVREVPIRQIEEAMSHYPEVDVRVQRRSPRGNLAFLGKWLKETSELMDIELWLKDTLGGGRYRIEARRADGQPGLAEPIPAFEVDIEGAPKIMKASDFDNATGTRPPVPAGAFVDSAHLPPFIRTMPRDQQVQYAQNNGIPVQTPSTAFGAISPGGPYTQPVASFASDQLAAQQLDETKKELQRERAAREADRSKWEQEKSSLERRFDALEEQRRQDQLAMERSRHEAEVQMLRSEMRSLAEKMSTPPAHPKPVVSAELVGALAPVLTAFITSNGEQRARSLEMQSQGVNNLLTATMQKADHKPLLEIVGAAMPLLLKYWESKSPKAQADLVATMAENQLTSISMMAELVNSFGQSQENPPWWLPMAQQTMAGIVNAAEAMASKNKEYGSSRQQMAAQQQQQQPAQQQPAQSQGQIITQRILSDPLCPEWCKTQEWATALVLMHDQRPVEDVAQYIANLMQTLDAENRMPQELAGFWDAADEVLLAIFQPLPVWMFNQEYASKVINRIIEVCSGEEDQAQTVENEGQSGFPVETEQETGPGTSFIDTEAEPLDQMQFLRQEVPQKVAG